jgi:phage shock protein A
MKTPIKLLLAAGLVLPLFAFSSIAIVHAEETSTASSSPTSEPKVAEDKASIQKRIEERKAALKTKITSTEEARLKLRCKASQGTVSSLKGKVTGIETSRDKVYDGLVARLTSLQTKLKAQDVDTAVLDSEITVLQTKITTFKADLTAYKAAVTDLAGMECATDPTGFKASLEAARAAREKVKKDATDIRTYVTATIKPTLQQIRATLEAKKATTEGATN